MASRPSPFALDNFHEAQRDASDTDNHLTPPHSVEDAYRASSASSGVHSYYLSPYAGVDQKPAASASTFSFNATDDQRHMNVNLPTGASSSSFALASSSQHKKSSSQSWRRRRRRWRSAVMEALLPDSLACKLYLLVVLVETFLDIVLESIILSRVNTFIDARGTDTNINDRKLALNRVPVYLTIFGIAHVFQFGLALDAVYYKNVLQFLFLAIFNFLFFVYGVIQIFEVRDTLGGTIEPLTIVIPIVIALAEVAYIFLGYRIYRDFGWQVFKFIGADRKLRRLFTHYQIFECLLRFDAFFWLGFSIQLISLVLTQNDFEFYLTIAAVPLCMLLLFEGHLGARHESRFMMIIFAFGMLAAMVYFCYKLFRIWTQRTTPTFKDVFKLLTVFAAIAIGMLILSSIWAWIVYRNFESGLKSMLNKNKAEKKLQAAAEDAYANGEYELELGHKGIGTDGAGGGGKRFPAGANPNRISIE